MTDINSKIKDNNSKDPVVLYMKGNPTFPQCGFSSTVVQILKHIGVNFQSYDVLQDENLREGIKSFSNWPTIPQLYVNNEFVGGCDIIREMFESGDIIAYLLQTYGPSEESYDKKALWPITFEAFSISTSTIVAILRDMPAASAAAMRWSVSMVFLAIIASMPTSSMIS